MLHGLQYNLAAQFVILFIDPVKKMKTFAFLALLIAFASARPFQYQEEFNTWKRSFAKQYESEEVENQRQRIWEFNRDYVANHNALAARGKIGFTLEMNVFADLVSCTDAFFLSVY